MFLAYNIHLFLQKSRKMFEKLHFVQFFNYSPNFAPCPLSIVFINSVRLAKISFQLLYPNENNSRQILGGGGWLNPLGMGRVKIHNNVQGNLYYFFKGRIGMLTTPVFNRPLSSPDVIILFENLVRRITGGGSSRRPPPPIIFERHILLPKTIHRCRIHFKYWKNILISEIYEQFSRV